MLNALRVAATGMNAQQKNVDVLSNNIANISTTAFKRSDANFTDLIYQNEIAAGATTSDNGTIAPTGSQVGLGVRLAATSRVLTQGGVDQTDDPYNIAIQGRGYFQVLMPNGDLSYTRDGTFKTDQTGALVTKDGYQVQPSIVVPDNATNITISTLGQVTASVNGVKTTLGQITINMFSNPAGLEALGNNYLRETEASGPAIEQTPNSQGAGTLLQGFVERSNVDPVLEITKLISAQRSYELNSRVISAVDQMLQSVNQIS